MVESGDARESEFVMRKERICQLPLLWARPLVDATALYRRLALPHQSVCGNTEVVTDSHLLRARQKLHQSVCS